MNKIRSLFILAVVLLFAKGSLQSEPKFRRAVAQSNRIYRCGEKKRQVEGLITNGSNTKLGEWPWHGALFYRKNRKSREYKCGATLIRQNYVTTAGHCVVDRESGYEVNPNSITVDFGYVQLFSPSSHGQSHSVLEIFVHPEFSKDSNKHDVAVLSLKTVVRFSDYILPICLGLSKTKNAIHDLIGKQGVVVGWGLTETDTESSHLKMANLPVVDYPECQESDPDLFGPLIYSGMFCAGSKNGTSVCNGDSGGGMYFKKGRAWTLRGITSFSGARTDGTNKCDVNKYAGFMNVQYYAPWIGQIINEEYREVENDTSNENRTETYAEPLSWRDPPRGTTTTDFATPPPRREPPRGTTSLDFETSRPWREPPRGTFNENQTALYSESLYRREPPRDTTTTGFANPPPWPEPPRGTTATNLAITRPWYDPHRGTLNTTNFATTGASYDPCSSGERCLEGGECMRIHSRSDSSNTRNLRFDSRCGNEEIANTHLMCCEMPDSEGYDDDPDPCGKRKLSSYPSSRPTHAESDEYPWMVKLASRSNIFECQGVLVSRSYVLMSAFCRPTTGIEYARLGAASRRCSIYAGCYTMRVLRIIYHPQFSLENEPSPENSPFNIALAELEFPMEINRYVNTICLPTSEPKLSTLFSTSFRFSYQRTDEDGTYVNGIHHYSSLQHFSLSYGEAPSPDQMFAIFQGAPLQLESESGQMVLIGMETRKQFRRNETYDYAIIVTPVADWIRQVVGIK